jgi:hypothetical protein
VNGIGVNRLPRIQRFLLILVNGKSSTYFRSSLSFIEALLRMF